MVSGGKCSLCKVKLTRKNYHADHIHPYSKGGRTITANGQALCDKCNLRKGNKTMKTKMRDWQKEALDKSLKAYSNHNRNFAIDAAPGAGKTKAAIFIAMALVEKGVIDRVIVIAPKREIVRQWAKDFKKITGRTMMKITGKNYRGIDPADMEEDICLTWQAVSGLKDALQEICEHHRVFVVGDEVHHAALGAVWGDGTDKSLLKAKHALALTGTPTRSDGLSPIWLDDNVLADPSISYTVSYEYAIDQRWCVPVAFSKVSGEIKVNHQGQTIVSRPGSIIVPPALEPILSDSDMRKLEFAKLIKQPVMDGNGKPAANPDSYHVKVITEAYQKLEDLRNREYGKFGIPDAGCLVIANSIEMAKYYDELIRILYPDERPVIVHSGESNNEYQINKYRKGESRFLVSVNMISEGVDIPRLRVMVLMPSATTELYFRQAIGRIIRKDDRHGDPSMDNSRAYCIISAVEPYIEYAKTIEGEMGSVEPPPAPECPHCHHQGVRPTFTSPCPECGYHPPEPPLDEWECNDWSDECCGHINIGGQSCHHCGLPRHRPFEFDLKSALGYRDGVTSRGGEYTEEEAKASEGIADEFQRLLIRRGDPRLSSIMAMIPEEQYSSLASLFDELKKQHQASTH